MAIRDHLSVSSSVSTFFCILLVVFLTKLYRKRVVFARLRNGGLPMPPWNPFLGHLYFCYKITLKLPTDAHPNYLPGMVRRELPDLGPVFYLDTWPIGPQMLIVASTEGLYQITQEHSLPKHPGLRYFIRPIADGVDLVTMEGHLWKRWRGIFNPGFSAAYLMSLTRGIAEETEQFCRNLQKLAEDQTLCRMKDLTDNLTMDIIGRVVMNAQLGSQVQSSPLVDGLRMQVRWCTFGAEQNPFKRYNPMRPIVHWYNSRRMNKYVTRTIDSRFAELTSGQESHPEHASKSIIDLVLTAYLSEKPLKDKLPDMDTTFKRFTMNQIKLFLFAGHDTTSSTMCYIFYILATKPEVRVQVRAEHDSVFGSETSKTALLIMADPTVLNRLPYTIAVIKEVLRMYPSVSSARIGEPDFNIVDAATGQRFPTQDFLVWDVVQGIHRDPAYWPRPDDFVPERWLALAPGDPLHPIKGAYRPFSHGPRNCIGQELAMMELKVFMALTARQFDITLGYEGLDQAAAAANKSKDIIRTVGGERGYQISRAQPEGDLPCYVKARDCDA